MTIVSPVQGGGTTNHVGLQFRIAVATAAALGVELAELLKCGPGEALVAKKELLSVASFAPFVRFGRLQTSRQMPKTGSARSRPR